MTLDEIEAAIAEVKGILASLSSDTEAWATYQKKLAWLLKERLAVGGE